jgi:pyruvate/2-oxoacid:ferredoxin oxidoreductase alpha subunit
MSEVIESSFFDIEKPSEDAFTRAKQSLYYNPQTQSQFCIIMDWFHHEIKQARAEAIEEGRKAILEIIEERTNTGLEDMEGADYKEFVQAEFFVIAMGIVKDEVIKALTKLSEVEK